MKRRANYFRALLVVLECGCEAKISTGLYRLTKARAACLWGSYVRSGVWCHKHGGKCQATKFLGVTRL